MILVTSAGGKTGRAVICALVAKGLDVRALVRCPGQIRACEELGAREVIDGDLLARADLNRAYQGVTAVYHICPNMHPEETAIGEIAIAAARAHGVEDFVYHSVLHPQTEAMPHHWNKLRVEETLFESGLAYTILQPAPYMQNLLPYWERIVDEGVFAVPYSQHAKLSLVDLRDVAEVAAIVVANPGHQGAIYELCGPDVLSPVSQAAVLQKHLRRGVRVEEMPLEEWARRTSASAMEEYQVRTLSAMFRYYGRNGFWGNSRVLQWLLGRPPTTFASFVHEIGE